MMLSYLLLLAAYSASADASVLEKPYGELTRFGGCCAVEEKLGLWSPGKFVYPVGFAVEPENPTTEEQNDVYVLDRVVNEEVPGGESKLGYRLQKLSSTGTPLASVTLPVEASFGEDNEDARPMVSLALDAAKHRVYALVEGIVASGGEAHVPVAQRVVAWSTTPSASTLVKAPEFPEDPVTHASLVAGPATLEPAEVSEDLYAPQGLTIASNGDLVIEAQHGVSELEGGPTVLQRVSTAVHASGEGSLDGAPWVAEGIAPSNQQADGVFTANDGSFGVDLYEHSGSISRLADVSSDFTTANLIAPDSSGNVNLDEAPSIDGKFTVNYHGQSNGSGIRKSFAAASPITQLTNNLYAARYAHQRESSDAQTAIEPWGVGGELESFWTELKRGASVGNVGIRLFDASGHIEGTIGGQASGVCSLDTNALGVAAGSNETLFVLTQPNAANGNSDDEVIEFAPGGKGACPQPSGSVVVESEGKPVAGSEGVFTVHQSVPVTFSASPVNRAGESPYEFDWNLEETGFTITEQMAGPEFKWPSPEVKEYTFQTPGVFKDEMRLVGDYGTTVFPFTVKVLGTEAPVAVFSCPAPIVAGQPATCDASASKPTGGSEISSYHWEFSDGGGKPTNVPSVKHTFANPGTYTIKLFVEDEQTKQSSTTVEQKVTVTAASSGGGGDTGDGDAGGGGGGGPVPGSGTAPSPGPAGPNAGPGTKPPASSGSLPLTSQQKLAKALKVCRKDKPKKKRASCEKQAKKKYAPKKHAKKKK